MAIHIHQKQSYTNISINKIHRTLTGNEWLNNIKIKVNNSCSFCNNVNTISHFVIDCSSNIFFKEKVGEMVRINNWFQHKRRKLYS